VRVSGVRAASVRELRVARSWAGTHGATAVLGPRVRDAEGEIRLLPRRDDGGPDDVFDLTRAPQGGDLLLTYRAAASTASTPFALHVAPDRMSGVGHAFLLLPRLDDALPVRVRTHTGELSRGADGASSFGFGSTVEALATSEDLAHAVYVAGMLWRESPADAGARADDLVVLGDPPFDTRAALDRAEATRDAIDRFFRAPLRSDAMRFFLVGQPGLGSVHEGAFLTRSIGVWLDAQRTYDGALALVIAHELAHRFLGGAVRLVRPDGHEAGWFAEGFAVHVARRAMLEAGLLTPGDFAGDLNRTVGVSASAADRLPRDYLVGASLAAWLDAELRRATAGRASVAEVLRDLVARGGSLPVSALVDAVRSRASAVAADLDRAIRRVEAGDETPVDVPEDAFGPCVRRSTHERRAVDLGFDRRSLDGTPKMVRGLIHGSAAEAAGLREGTLVLDAKLPDADGPTEVDLLLGDGRRVRYRAVTTKREATWAAGDPDACRADLAARSRRP
jgi:hypothetical protein